MNSQIFDLEFLDHVAIRVKDLKESAKWYEKVFGLKPYQFDQWGDFPIFMVKKNFGIALFPANVNDKIIPASKNVKIDHFAFRISPEHYEKAIEHFQNIGLSFEEQDHHHFMSIYVKDPDGHMCELTKIKGNKSPFRN